MFIKFLVEGYQGEPERMKSVARRVSHQLPDAEEQGINRSIRFERYDEIIKRPLTKRETVFGVKSPPNGGGCKGLVNWRAFCRPAEATIEMARAKILGADEWIEDFVRRVILEAGWKIVKQENQEVSLNALQ